MSRLIRSSQPLFPKEDLTPLLQDIGKVLEEGQFRNGKTVKIFEDMIAKYVGTDGAVAFDSDSSAFETVLRYFGAVGKEVVVCTNSFISVPNSVLAVGAKVVFSDVKADSLSMDPKSLQQNISPNTAGVIVTHISGFPNPDLKSIMQICRENGLFLIEDATHSIGASVDGRMAGSFGDAGVFSFTPTKVLTTGEGGMLVSDNLDLCDFAKKFSFYGSGVGKTNFVDLGRHMVLPEISAVLGIYQLRRLEEFIVHRNQIAKLYDQAFSEINSVQTVECASGTRSSYYKYPLILSEVFDRVSFAKRLLEEFGVETGNIFYPPCHMQAVYKKLGAFSYGSLSVAEQVLSRTVALPIHAALSIDEASFVVDKVKLLLEQQISH